MGANPVGALGLNIRAVERYGLPAYPRFQLILTLHNLTVRYGKRAKLSPDAADLIYEIAASASPHHPSVLASRAEYLLNSRRGNAEPLVERLKQNASLQEATWMLDAAVAARKGENQRVAASIRKALAILDARGRYAEQHFRNAFRSKP